MHLPAFLFDGRDILDLEALREIGFEVKGIGKGRSLNYRYFSIATEHSGALSLRALTSEDRKLRNDH